VVTAVRETPQLGYYPLRLDYHGMPYIHKGIKGMKITFYDKNNKPVIFVNYYCPFIGRHYAEENDFAIIWKLFKNDFAIERTCSNIKSINNTNPPLEEKR
jgi:hypothetical protein